MFICVGMILLDNLLQYLLFIVVIDLSKTCDSIATLICNVLVMFMIYPYIKIKLKLLIFSTTFLTIPQICARARGPSATTAYKAGCGLSKSLDRVRVY
jgi:hypothetical protein